MNLVKPKKRNYNGDPRYDPRGFVLFVGTFFPTAQLPLGFWGLRLSGSGVAGFTCFLKGVPREPNTP